MSTHSILITKIGVVETFDTTKLPKASVEYAMEYGLRKAINDAHASVKREDFPAGDAGNQKFHAAVRDLAYKRVKQLRDGTVPTVRGVVDPWEVIAGQLGITVAEAKKRMNVA